MGLVGPQHVGSPWTRDQTHVFCIGKWILYHWARSVAPWLHLLQIFSPIPQTLFILFMVSFAVQKLLSLIRSHLFILVFVSFTLEDGSKKLCQNTSYVRMSWVLFSSVIYFEFIFVYGVGECSNFILLHVAVQFSQHYLLKRLSFLHCIFLPPLS